MENRKVSELIKKFESKCMSDRPRPNPVTDCCSKETFLASSAQIQKYYESRIKVNTSVLWEKRMPHLKPATNYTWFQPNISDDDFDDEDECQEDDDVHTIASRSSFDVFLSATSLTLSLNNYNSAADMESNESRQQHVAAVPPFRLHDARYLVREFETEICSSDGEFEAESFTTLYSFASNVSENCERAFVPVHSDVNHEYFDGLCALFSEEVPECQTATCIKNERPSTGIEFTMAEVEQLFKDTCAFNQIGIEVEYKFAQLFHETFCNNAELINASVRLFDELMP